MRWVRDMLLVSIVEKVHIGYARGVLLFRRLIAPVLERPGRETFEFHYILGQGPCFVAENVVHHAQLFVEVRRLHGGREAPRLVAARDVDRDEVGLDKVDHLQRHEERHGHEVHQGDEPNASLLQDHHGQLGLVVLAIRIDIPVPIPSIVGPQRGHCSSDDTEHQLEDHGDHNVIVRGSSDFRYFVAGIRAVFHDFGLMARVDAHADDPLRVSQTATT